VRMFSRLFQWLRTSRRARYGALAAGLMLAAAVAAGAWWLTREKRTKVYRPPGPLRGKRAPEIIDRVEFWLNGGEVALASLKKKPVLLVFWHPRDGGKSLAALPHVRDLADAFASKGLTTIGFCVLDEPKDLEPVLRDHKIAFRVGLDCDADLHKQYRIDVVGTPYAYLVDGKGVVAWDGPPDELDARDVRKLLP